MKKLVLFVLCLGVVTAPPSWAATAKKAATKGSTAQPQAKGVISRDPYIGAIVVEASSGKVLVEDRADAKGYPASMLKLIDIFIILDKVAQKQISLQDMVPVSAKAAETGGSQVWLAEKETFSVEDLLYALMVQSANDAAVALAEKIAGSTDGFLELMNQKARALGMNNTVFRSVHGLPPTPGQPHDVTTPRDFAILCRALVAEHPEVLRYTSTRERSFRTNVPKKTVVMRTHNHLLKEVEGCDGLKTGYITVAGYSVAVSATRNGRRVIAVVLGSKDRKVRDAKAAELIAKGFSELGPLPSPAPAAVPAGPAPAAAKR